MQTPQAFVAAKSGRPARGDLGEGSDCASLVEAVGGRVKVVDGDERLLKVTTPPTSSAEALLAVARESQARA